MTSKTASCIAISIHAPAKGATILYAKSEPFDLISIHAPAKGATITDNIYYTFYHNFNPRSREGSD